LEDTLRSMFLIKRQR